MRNFTILPVIAALAIFVGGTAMAQERVTASATLVNPATQQYVGTFVESCLTPTPKIQKFPAKALWPYVGVYLAKSFDLQSSQFLTINGNASSIFTTTRHANGEEVVAYEVGGLSSSGCMAAGTKIDLIYGQSGMNLPLIVVGTGTVKTL
jgi:hypothetical protein